MDKKAAAQAVKDKQALAAAEADTAREWSQGANNRKAGRDAATQEREEEKRKREEEKRRALAAEEEELGGIKTTVKKKKKKKGEGDPLLALLAEGTSEKNKTKFEKMEAKKKKEKEERRKKQRDEEAAAATAAAGPREDPLIPELTENLNRQMSMEEDASGIDGAIDLLSGGGGGGGLEKHPERRQKAAYAEFEERMMEQLKEELPGLKRSQYKERIFALWKKSPENPMNQQTEAYNAKVDGGGGRQLPADATMGLFG